MLLYSGDTPIVSLSYLESNSLPHCNSISTASGYSSPTFFLLQSPNFASIIASIAYDAIYAFCFGSIPTMMLKCPAIACIITTIHRSSTRSQSSLIIMSPKGHSCCTRSSLFGRANARRCIISSRRLSRRRG